MEESDSRVRHPWVWWNRTSITDHVYPVAKLVAVIGVTFVGVLGLHVFGLVLIGWVT